MIHWHPVATSVLSVIYIRQGNKIVNCLYIAEIICVGRGISEKKIYFQLWADRKVRFDQSNFQIHLRPSRRAVRLQIAVRGL